MVPHRAHQGACGLTRNVLIIGATSAIAAEVVKLYAAKGDRLFLIGRDPAKLAALVDAVTAAAVGDAVVGHVSCDLDELEQNAARVAAAIDALGGLDLALIAHGYLGDQIRSEGDPEYAQKILTTNFLSAVSLAMPIANYLERQGKGHLGVITSVAGERGRPRNYTYGAAKGGLTKYLQGLRSRMYRTDVWIHNLKLGPVDTPMTVGHEKNLLFGEKVKVAKGIVKALGRRRHVTYLPRVWALVMFVVRGLPEPIFQRFGFLAGR